MSFQCVVDMAEAQIFLPNLRWHGNLSFKPFSQIGSSFQVQEKWMVQFRIWVHLLFLGEDPIRLQLFHQP